MKALLGVYGCFATILTYWLAWTHQRGLSVLACAADSAATASGRASEMRGAVRADSDCIAAGCTRIVWLFETFVIKLARLQFGIRRGMQANRNERNWWRWYQDPRTCPVMFADPFGFIVVMPRAQRRAPDDVWDVARTGYFDGLPEDHIPENVGWINDRPVMIDYGALSHPPPQRA